MCGVMNVLQNDVAMSSTNDEGHSPESGAKEMMSGLRSSLAVIGP